MLLIAVGATIVAEGGKVGLRAGRQPVARNADIPMLAMILLQTIRFMLTNPLFISTNGFYQGFSKI